MKPMKFFYVSGHPERDGAPGGGRPRLNLQKRTKPKEDAYAPSSSIFGGAKPVDTAARERQIEEKLRHTMPNVDDKDIRR